MTIKGTNFLTRLLACAFWIRLLFPISMPYVQIHLCTHMSFNSCIDSLSHVPGAKHLVLCWPNTQSRRVSGELDACTYREEEGGCEGMGAPPPREGRPLPGDPEGGPCHHQPHQFPEDANCLGVESPPRQKTCPALHTPGLCRCSGGVYGTGALMK